MARLYSKPEAKAGLERWHKAKRKGLGLESLDSFNPRGDKVSYVSPATQLDSPLQEATGLQLLPSRPPSAFTSPGG